MNIMKEKIKKTFEASKRVIRDCAIENGAPIAANPTKKYYSNQAKHYFLRLAPKMPPSPA